MYGIDLSKWQDGIDLTKTTFDFAIIKATEGIGYKDPTFSKFAIKLNELNRLIGCYHFARPDHHGTIKGMEDEADWFLSIVESQGLIGKAILVLDWEREPMDREDLVDAWVNRIKAKTGVIPMIYGSRSKLTRWKNWEVMKRCPIWMAAWPSTGPLKAGEEYKGTISSKSIVDWKIWQYSSTGVFTGFKGNVDLNYCSENEDWWIATAGGHAPKEVISDDMQWAITHGLFIGNGDGKYFPKEPMTREQFASVLRRYNKLIDGVNNN